MDAKVETNKLTWLEFKQLCERYGVRDNDEIDGIDISWGSADFLTCKKDDDFGWQISLRAT